MRITPVLSFFEEPEPKRGSKGKEKKDDNFYSIFGVGKKELSSKRRRGLILRSLRGGIFRTAKPRDVLRDAAKIRKSKERTKPDPRFFFEIHKVIRRRRRV